MIVELAAVAVAGAIAYLRDRSAKAEAAAYRTERYQLLERIQRPASIPLTAPPEPIPPLDTDGPELARVGGVIYEDIDE